MNDAEHKPQALFEDVPLHKKEAAKYSEALSQKLHQNMTKYIYAHFKEIFKM